MTSQHAPQPAPINLHCCNQTAAPPNVVDGWQRYLKLPKAAKSNIWNLLGPVVLEPANPNHDALLVSFCKEYALSKEAVVLAVQACGFVLSRASALDLGLEPVHEDLAALCGNAASEHQDAMDILLTRYDGFKTQVRRLVTLESMADHGKVLVGLDWRVDKFSASHRGANLDTTVVLLTMRYRDGNQVDRVTLQLTPDALNELKLFCDRFKTGG